MVVGKWNFNLTNGKTLLFTWNINQSVERPRLKFLMWVLNRGFRLLLYCTESFFSKMILPNLCLLMSSQSSFTTHWPPHLRYTVQKLFPFWKWNHRPNCSDFFTVLVAFCLSAQLIHTKYCFRICISRFQPGIYRWNGYTCAHRTIDRSQIKVKYENPKFKQISRDKRNVFLLSSHPLAMGERDETEREWGREREKMSFSIASQKSIEESVCNGERKNTEKEGRKYFQSKIREFKELKEVPVFL